MRGIIYPKLFKWRQNYISEVLVFRMHKTYVGSRALFLRDLVIEAEKYNIVVTGGVMRSYPDGCVIGAGTEKIQFDPITGFSQKLCIIAERF